MKSLFNFITLIFFINFCSCNNSSKPIIISTSNQQSPADSIRASLVQKRTKHYERVFKNFMPDLDTSHIKNTKPVLDSFDVIDYPRGFNDSMFANKTNFSSQTFDKEIICGDTTFNTEVNFSFAHFLKRVDFSSNFNDYLDFLSTTFEAEAAIGATSVNGDVDFRDSKFNGKTYFTALMVAGDADFSRCIFSKYSFFNTARFNEHVNFNGAAFLIGANFRATKFGNLADFSDLSIHDSASLDFTGAVLPDTLDFSLNNNIKNEINLSDVLFTDSLHYDKKNDIYFRPHFISLYKSDISKFHLDYIHFRLITDSIIINGNEKVKIPSDEVESMYESLLSNFKNRGQMESYKLLDIEYQQYKLDNSRTPFLAIFPKYWWNFGYNKGRVFIWTIFFLLLFTLITFFSLNYLNRVYTLEKIGEVSLFTNSRFTVKDSFVRIWHSFVYTSTIFFRLTLKIEAIDYNKFWGTVYIILMYTVGLICLAYMANFVLQK